MDVVRKYWHTFSQKQGLTQALPDAWMFGDGSEKMGNELGQLVVQGLKTGTCSAKCIHELEEENIPAVGGYEIVLDGQNNPLAIIQYTKIEIVPMNEVSQEFAVSEGEGDLSYEYWYQEHEKFFRWELGQYSLPFTPTIELVCQSFKVVDLYSNK
ncbi:hypothetical protein DOK78_000158 [Enterococcus sp. DIV2402]|uniref:ASCH domain-containing protein n=1 Tax=Candidatus Enterococcus lowellii TaxID=2230877 RepID=A0ABZ2SJD5_9ENTE|nr:ASCH domain-containing protein [Enterococcus sp. DIV2402]MBO0463185.1 ASCH domain-containing protein [Enterococcus sp. DIV2402]